MFCMYCGTQLPDEAAFCFKCGKKMAVSMGNTVVDSEKEIPEKEIPRREIPKKVIPNNVAEESVLNMRNQKLLYVSGYGVYFIKEGAVAFYSEKTKSMKELKKEEDEYRDFWGLAMYRHAIYFWSHTDCEVRLYRVDLELNRKEIVFVDSDGLLMNCIGSDDTPITFKGEGYYFIDSVKNRLLYFSLITKSVEKRNLPDMRTVPFSEDWEGMGNLLILDEESVNYGNRLMGLYIVGNRGFVYVSGIGFCVLSFDLDNPADFEYMKTNTICPQPSVRLITTIGNSNREIFSVYEGFHCLQFDEEGHLFNTRTIVDPEPFEHSKVDGTNSDWFVVNGTIYYLGDNGRKGFIYERGKKPYLIKGNYHDEISGIKDSIDVPSVGKTFVITDERLLEFSYDDNIASIIENETFSQYVVAEWVN